jgi:predicted kinase
MEAVIFCGIQASGKTTFYLKHFFRTHVRISLDLLNTRNKETLFINTCLKIQQRFVIDNTNPTKAERKKYIERAKAQKFTVIGYCFQSLIEVSIERNSQRTGKENVPEIGIRGTHKRLEPPSYDEGFDVLYSVRIENGEFVTERMA